MNSFNCTSKYFGAEQGLLMFSILLSQELMSLKTFRVLYFTVLS